MGKILYGDFDNSILKLGVIFHIGTLSWDRIYWTL